MKKIFSIIWAGAAMLLAASCAMKEDLVVLDPSLCTAPVVNSYTATDEGIVVNFTPGVLNVDAPVYHALVLTKAGATAVNVPLNSIEKNGVLTITPQALSATLLNYGYADGDLADVEMLVRASAQQKQTGNHTGYIDSAERISVSGFEVVVPKGSPYGDYTQVSEWSLIGSMSAYGISWDNDLNMWTNGTGHVAAHVTLKAGDEVKFRKDQSWSVNMGGTLGALDTEFDVTQDGANIVIATDGVYDLYLYPDDGKAMVSAAYDPYPEYTEASNWSVIGTLSNYDISWDGDLAMISDGTNHVALSVSLTADDEFKFRQDASWTVNLGGDFGGIDTEFAVTQDGPNIVVGTEGVYDLFVNPSAGTATVATASGLKVSSIIGEDEPEEPVGVTGWNIIGLNGDWENDILATQDGNVWTAYITAEDATEFKWRKDGGWDENYGGTFVALGEPFEAVAGGDNIQVAAGFWKVVLDTDALTITISNGEVWSLIGDFNSWGDDVDMVLTDGKWVSPATKISGGFKIRHNHAWDENFGGTLVAIGEPFTAVAGGDNISVEEGNYVVTYDPEAGTILVDELGWGLVGTINSWGETPDIILKEDGLFLVARNVALSADDEVKLRYNQDWGVNRGGASKVGAVVKAVQDGANIKPGVAGNYDVYYRPDNEVIIVNEAGADLVYWGVVGTINGWGAPDYIMWDEDGKLVYEGLEIAAADQIKIRQNEDWAVNMGLVKGSAFPGLDEAFAVEQDGDNIVVGGDGSVDVIYDPEAGTITISGTVEGPTYDATEIAVCGSYSGNSWSPDSDPHLTGAAGKYTGFLAMYGGEFKFVYGGNNWIGGTADGLEYTLNIGGGDNMTIADGTYYWTVDLNSATASAVAIESVSLIGSFNGWGADEAMTLQSDYTYSASLTLDAGAEFKVRFNGSWDYNLGGDVNALTPGGDNIKVEEAGTYTVVLDLNATYATLTLTK